MKSGDKGFGVVELLLGLVVIGMVAGTGWYITSKNKTEKTNVTNSAITSPSSTPTPTIVADTETATTVKSKNSKFSVNLPSGWKYNSCSDHDGFLVQPTASAGVDCILSDAKWLEAEDIAPKAKIAIGFGANPYPRQDFTGGVQKDLYSKDATTVKLSNGASVLKFSYSMNESKDAGRSYKVTEYVTADETVSVFVFDGHSSESTYNGSVTTEDATKAVEDTILPSIKLL
jgi:hypothetical protein